MNLPEPGIPEIFNRPGRIDFIWKPAGVVVAVHRIRSHSDGRVTAHLIARSTDSVKPGLLHRGDLNLSATRSKHEFAKALQEAWALWDWRLAIEFICDRTLSWIETGEPAEIMTIDPVEEIVPPAYFLYPILPIGMPTILYGEGGTAKSTLAIGLALAAFFPWVDNPFGVVPLKTSQRALYLDWEMDKTTFRYRTSLYLRGHELPMVEMLYRQCFIPLYQDLEHIQDIVAEHQIDFLIIDSLGAATGGDLNLSEGPLTFFAALRQLRKTALVIAHTSKNKEGDRGVYGNVHFTNYARSVWEIQKSQGLSSPQMTLALVHRKYNISGQFQPIGMRFTFSPDSGPATALTVESANALTVEGVLNRFSLRNQILVVLKSGPASVSTLSAALGLTKEKGKQIPVRLSELRRGGEVISLPDNMWGLAYKNSS